MQQDPVDVSGKQGSFQHISSGNSNKGFEIFLLSEKFGLDVSYLF